MENKSPRPRYLPADINWDSNRFTDAQRELYVFYSTNPLERAEKNKQRQKQLDEEDAPRIRNQILYAMNIKNTAERESAFLTLQKYNKESLIRYCRFYGVVQKGTSEEILSRIRRHLEGTLEEKEMRKKPKLIDPAIQEMDLMELYKSNKLETAPLDALKLFCSKHFLHKNGTKKTLFARVRRYLLEHDETREVITPADAWKKFKESFPPRKYSCDDYEDGHEVVKNKNVQTFDFTDRKLVLEFVEEAMKHSSVEIDWNDIGDYCKGDFEDKEARTKFDGHTWFCKYCKDERDWREWHCNGCNTC